MSIKTRFLVGWLAWGVVALGVLNLGLIPGDFGHSLCGPWG